MICVIWFNNADAPMIISPEAANVSLSEGESYVLNCTATGMPVPDVVWTKDGGEVPQTVRIMLIKNGDVGVKAWVG